MTYPSKAWRACALGAALALAPLSAHAQDKLTLILDWFVNPNHGPIVIAEELGYFEAAGLEVEVIAPSDPSLPPKIVAAGEADLAVSYQPQLHLQAAEGLPLTRVGTLVASPLNCLLTLKNGPIGTLADLEGKKVGYSVAGVEQALITAVLAPVGLSVDDVEMINVNWSLSPALMSEQVDAVIGAFRNFELTQMEIEGVPGRCFAIEDHGAPSYDELIFVANADKVASDAAHRAALQRFLAVIERATARMINEPEASWETFSATSADLQDTLNERAWTLTLPRFALRPAALDHGRYAAFSAFLAENGLIPEVQAVETLAVDLNAP